MGSKQGANADFIDGDSPDVLQRRVGEMLLEVLLFDFFDHVPGNAKQISNVLNRHAAGQLQSVFGPALGVASAGFGKINFDLANGPAIMTLHTRQGGDDDGLFQADRRSPEFSSLEPSTDHVSTAAHWTAKRLFTWLDMKSRDTSGELDPGLPVAKDAKGLIQQGGGHVRFPKKT